MNLGLVDSFDSNLGPYSATNRCQKTIAPFDCGAELHANGAGASPSTPTVTVSTLYGNIIDSQGQVGIGTVYGDVTYDPVLGSCPNCNATNVKGSIIQATSPPVTVQPLQPCGPPYSPLAFVQSKITPTNQYSYNAGTGAFSMDPNTTVNIDATSGVFCFSTMNIKGVINLPSNLTTPVVINVTGTIVFTTANAAINNNTFKAAQLQILSSYDNTSSTGVDFGGQAGGYMYVYAPRTNILLRGGTDLYGATLGYDITTTGGAQLHFDKALGNSGTLRGGVPAYTWNAGSWKACQTPAC